MESLNSLKVRILSTYTCDPVYITCEYRQNGLNKRSDIRLLIHVLEPLPYKTVLSYEELN